MAIRQKIYDFLFEKDLSERPVDVIQIPPPPNPERSKNSNPMAPEQFDQLIRKRVEEYPEDRYDNFGQLKTEFIRIYNDLTGKIIRSQEKKNPRGKKGDSTGDVPAEPGWSERS